jgi:DNA polymerase V
VFAIIDANAFYCSCERAFNPALRGKPLVVLSNNDGCVIARSNEAKDLGLKMGDPWHLVSKKRGIEGVVDWRSSNYALYGDMSRRFYELLIDRFPRVEPYSIDEMFMDLTGMTDGMVERCAAVRSDVRRIAKIPTCVGIGPTKTIAKLANKIAKHDRAGPGVLDYSNPDVRAAAYRTIPMDEVWGMGRASVAKLRALEVTTVAEFVAMPQDLVRDTLTVTGLRTHAELTGVSCIPLTLSSGERKSIAVTRSFGRAVTTWLEMREAVASYATRAAEKARRHGMAAAAMQVFMHTNRFNGDPAYSGGLTFPVEPTSDTLALIGSAVRAARSVWKEGYRYAKAGVVFVDLYPQAQLPPSMFPSRDPVQSARLMSALDAVNARYGRGTLRPGGTAASTQWAMRRGRLSPRYTTAIDELMAVRA